MSGPTDPGTQGLPARERIDDMGFGGLRILQDPESFCYGVDAVLLADFAARRKARAIADLGTGNGAIPLILSAKLPEAKLTGLEIQERAYDLACRSAALNSLESRIRLVHGDVKEAADLLGAGRYDAVTANPPYVPRGRGLSASGPGHALARHEHAATLEDFLSAAAILLRPKGFLYMIHRPARLADLVTQARIRGLEPKELRLVAPAPGRPPNLLLAAFSKGGGNELRFQDTLYIRDNAGAYTREIETIYGRCGNV